MVSDIRVFVSGVNSDPDPSPGVGIARALKAADSHVRVMAVDYSTRSSGIHHECFDEACVQPVWSALDLTTYANTIRHAVSEANTCWISGLDVEIDWLIEAVGTHPRLLVPGRTAQDEVRKPECRAAALLGMRVPRWLPATADPQVLHRLGRHAGWRLWVKGKYHEAYPARQFGDIGRQIESLCHNWPLEDIFIQEHIYGLERAFTFAAYRGLLLGAVEVEKRAVTSQGKTWAAAVKGVDTAILGRLRELANGTNWTGGGEVEFVRDSAGEDWLIDFNPRFPAYIYGVALCGHNLPSRLVAAALGMPSPPEQPPRPQFIRVVHEIPVREDFPLPPLVRTCERHGAYGKHPSFQPQLVRRMAEGRLSATGKVRKLPLRATADSMHPLHALAEVQTPIRIRHEVARSSALQATCHAIAQLSAQPRIIPALSIKTDPWDDLGTTAVRLGWWAEAISVQEVDWALSCGFRRDQIVFNGPAANALRASDKGPLASAFADSTEALDDVLCDGVCDVAGARLRLPSTISRFGIDVSEPNVFAAATRKLAARPNRAYGVHFHVAADACGPSRWFELIEEAIVWVRAFTISVGRAPKLLDVGGGWHHEDFHEILLPSLRYLQDHVRSALPSVEAIILEPGKAVSTMTASMLCEITEVRTTSTPRGLQVVIDAAVADLPMAPLYAYAVTLYREGTAIGCLTGGTARVLGRSCMEADLLADRVSFPVPPRVGDRLLFSGAGGYNASMAYHFGRGSNGETRLQ